MSQAMADIGMNGPSLHHCNAIGLGGLCLIRWTIVLHRLRCLILAWGLLASEVFGALPEILDFQPRGVAPGRATELVIRGNNLKNVTHIWTSFPARCESLSDSQTDDGKQLRCRITVGRHEAVGIGAIRVATSEGVSPWMLIMVDDLPSANEGAQQPNKDQTRSLELPIAMDGHIDPLQSDDFRFTGRSGQIVTVDAVAQRLASPLDATLILRDPNGTIVAQSDDSQGTGADSRFSCQLHADGEYRLELRDVRFRGGAEFRYRLRIGSFPLLQVAFPMGGIAGGVSDFEWVGEHVAGLAPASVTIPKSTDLLNGYQFVSVSHPSQLGSGFVPIAVTPFPEQMEVEPNHDSTHATAISRFPVVVNGRCQVAADLDCFRLRLQQGERVRIAADARRWGSPAEIFLRLTKSDGVTISEATSSAADGVQITFVPPATDDYFVHVEDLFQRGSNSHAYRFTVDRAPRGFSLAVHTDTLNSPQAGSFVCKVTAARDEYKGPIALRLIGLPYDVTLDQAEIPADKDEVEFKATLPDSYLPGQLHQVYLVGEADVDGQRFSAKASTYPALRARMQDGNLVPRFLESQMALGVGPKFADFFSLQVEPGAVYYGRGVGKARFKVLVQRLQETFQGSVNLAIQGLPDGVTAEAKAIAEGQKEVEIDVAGPAELPAEMSSITIVGTAVFQNQTRQVTLSNVPVQVIPPLRVTVQPAGTFQLHQPQHVTIRVQRFGDERHPVTLAWKQGPVGLLAPIDAVIPADKDEFTASLVFTTAPASDSTPTLVVAGSTLVQGNTIVAESSPVELPFTRMPSEGT